MKTSTIKCPHCNETINVDEVLAHSTEERIRKEFTDRFANQKQQVEKQLSEIEQKELGLKKQQEKLDEQAEERVAEILRTQKPQLENKLRKQLEAKNEDALTFLKNENIQQFKDLKEFNKTKIEFETLKREKDGLENELSAKMQRELNAGLAEGKLKIKEQADAENELHIKDLEKKLADQKKQADDMKRKLDQGSMQTQGEVQELAIEEFLTDAFPLDSIQEIGKGVRGGDCIQTVNTHFSQNCGKIYYESKRTKVFKAEWIEKFKQDMRNEGVDMGVIVTQTMPKDLPHMGLKDGVYICTFEEFKSLCQVLRHGIIQLNNVASAQVNKGGKMEMLYSFLTSNEFKMQVEAIAEGFGQMKYDLEKEKAAMQRLWKKREKQIEKVTINTLDMHGAIKGIAGNAIQEVKALELGADYLENEKVEA